MTTMNTKIDSHFLSLVIPVYKKEATIIDNLKKIKEVLDKIRYDYEIITVIDGIVDDSFDRIKNTALGKVKCIVYEKNLGKSLAIRIGMNEAKGDYVMFLDAGREIDPNGISMLLEHMEWYDADIIVGSKRHLASQVKYSLSRRILSYGYYMLVKILFGVRIHDTQAGIKIIKRDVVQKILPRMVEKKFAGDLELIVIADALGFKKIYEAPIKLDYTLGDLTSAATVKSILHILTDTLAIFYRKNILHYYNKTRTRLVYPKDLKIIKY